MYRTLADVIRNAYATLPALHDQMNAFHVKTHCRLVLSIELYYNTQAYQRAFPGIAFVQVKAVRALQDAVLDDIYAELKHKPYKHPPEARYLRYIYLSYV